MAALFPVRVTNNRTLTGGYFCLDLETEAGEGVGSDPLAETQSGQFVMLRGEWGRDLVNPRAFSVLDVPGPGKLSVLLKVFGRGTDLMRGARPGDRFTCTGPLGRPFPRPREGVTQLLVAGGVGLPPLHLHARRSAAAGLPRAVEMFYGGRSAAELVLTDDFEAWGVPHVLSTDDGSRGVRGRVTVPLAERLDAAKARGESVEVLSCGPTPMLRAVRELGLERDVPTFLCLEEHMACGFGVCLGCAVPVYGERPYKYCCTDGPVFDAREVRWP